MKNIKVCDHCDKKFKNRKNLINHMMTFHGIDIFVVKPKKKPKEDKPLRRVRMMMNAARVKKEREFVSRKAHKHGIR